MAVWIVIIGVALAALVVGILVVRQRSEQLGVAPPRRASTARERRLDPGAAERETGLRPPDQFGKETDDYADAASYGSHTREVFAEPEPLVEDVYEEPISAYEDAVEKDWQAASVAEVELEAIRHDEAVAYEAAPVEEEYLEEDVYEAVPDDEEPARFTANRRVRDITPLETDEVVAPEPEPEPEPEPVAEVMAADSTLAGLTKRTPKEAGTPTRPLRVTANQRPGGGPRRSPEEVRKTLSNYRGGLRKGRDAETDGLDDGV